MTEMSMTARVAQYALNHKGRLNPTTVAMDLEVDRKAVQSAFNSLYKRGLLNNMGRGQYQAQRAKIANAYDFSEFTEEDSIPTVLPGVTMRSPRFKPVPFVVLQDSEGSLWLAEKLR